jgi:hypothetical protein
VCACTAIHMQAQLALGRHTPNSLPPTTAHRPTTPLTL